jgi:HK97 family phage prohead protease
MIRHLLENLLTWIRSTRPAEPTDSAGEFGTLRHRIDKELWQFRADGLDRQINRFNLASDPYDWIPNVNGEYPHGRIKVLGAPFNRATSGVDYPANELFWQNAFAPSLDNGRDIAADIQHDKAKVFARRSECSLTLWQEATGLWLRALLCGKFGREALDGVKGGRLTGASVAFDPKTAKYLVVSAPKRTLCISRCDLTRVALTDSPAYSETKSTIYLEERKMETTLMVNTRPSERRHGQHDFNGEIEFRSRLASDARRIIEARRRSERYPGEYENLLELLKLSEIE